MGRGEVELEGQKCPWNVEKAEDQKKRNNNRARNECGGISLSGFCLGCCVGR